MTYDLSLPGHANIVKLISVNAVTKLGEVVKMFSG